MSGRASVLAEGATPSREPSYRDGLGLGGRVPGGSQRPRQSAKKHPEPLRRAVADCLSSSHHVSPTEALRTVQVFRLFSSVSHILDAETSLFCCPVQQSAPILNFRVR